MTQSKSRTENVVRCGFFPMISVSCGKVLSRMMSPNLKDVIDGIVRVAPYLGEASLRDSCGRARQLPVGVATLQEIDKVLHFGNAFRRQGCEFLDQLPDMIAFCGHGENPLVFIRLHGTPGSKMGKFILNVQFRPQKYKMQPGAEGAGYDIPVSRLSRKCIQSLYDQKLNLSRFSCAEPLIRAGADYSGAINSTVGK
jgi:hypothetical protein